MGKVNAEMHSIYVNGRLSDLYLDTPCAEASEQKLVGMPIKNCNGIIIGRILGVDVGSNSWYGRIVINSELRDLLLDDYIDSMSMVVKQK